MLLEGWYIFTSNQGPPSRRHRSMLTWIFYRDAFNLISLLLLEVKNIFKQYPCSVTLKHFWDNLFLQKIFASLGIVSVFYRNFVNLHGFFYHYYVLYSNLFISAFHITLKVTMFWPEKCDILYEFQILEYKLIRCWLCVCNVTW